MRSDRASGNVYDVRLPSKTHGVSFAEGHDAALDFLREEVDVVAEVLRGARGDVAHDLLPLALQVRDDRRGVRVVDVVQIDVVQGSRPVAPGDGCPCN